MTTYERQIHALIVDAIRRKTPIMATYQGHVRYVCPHVIGTKNGTHQMLGYQYAGSSSSGSIVPGSTDNWRCMRLADMYDVRPCVGAWHTASNHSRPQTCVDQIYAEVAY